jgi:cytoskeletal protein CcmA (bactofilin family)
MVQSVDYLIIKKMKEHPVKVKSNMEFGHGGELNTIIGKGTVIDGSMKVQNSLRIDGKVKGNIVSTDTVIVGKEGEVIGQIQAKHVLLAGKVQGNMSASGKVVLEAQAVILGDIKSSRLMIDEGALFDGKCMMKEKLDTTQNRGKSEGDISRG